jgi:thiamine pyrophosphokinase
MRIGIYAGMDVGDVLDRTIPYIGADAGVSHLLKYKLHPTLAIGDFDSLCDLEFLDDLKIKKYPSRKDQTDTQLALEYAINKGYDEIDIYGVTGGRIDHFFSIMCLLEQYKDLDIRVIDATNIISILKPGHHELMVHSKYFSLFALDECKVSLSHCEYPLSSYQLRRDDPLCVSNESDEKVHIDNDAYLYFIQSERRN